MKIENLLLYGIIAYFAYRLVFKNLMPNVATGMPLVDSAVPDGGNNTPMNGGAPGASTVMPYGANGNDATTVGAGGKYYFTYVGSSALRQINGVPVDCGRPGNPFTSAGVETHFAKNGYAPTTYFAVLEMGTKASVYEGYKVPMANVKDGSPCIKVGDKIQISITGGQFDAMDNQIVTVLQLGTDACTSSKQPELKQSGIVVDLPIILEGADDYQYPAQDAIGYFEKI